MLDTVGDRVRHWRMRRKLTQDELAGLAGVSQAWISKIESGRRTVDKRSSLVALAGALRVTVADLLGEHADPTDPAKAAAAASVLTMRAALVEIEEGERRTPVRTPEEMTAAVHHLTGLRARADYVAMARILPELLLDAAAHGGLYLARVGYEAATTLKNTGYRDLALPAARVAVMGAQDAEDPAWLGAAQFFHSVALPVEAANVTSRVAERAMGTLQAKAGDRKVRQMLGQLHLSAALACAVDNRPDDAQAHLWAARDEADTLGGDPPDGKGFNLLAFGPSNITLWEMTVAAELGEHGKVIELSDKVNPTSLAAKDRHYSYWINSGLALARVNRRNDEQALAAFAAAEQAAPVPFSLNTAAHDAVVAMIYRAQRRAVSPRLRTLAGRLGIQIDSYNRVS